MGGQVQGHGACDGEGRYVSRREREELRGLSEEVVWERNLEGVMAHRPDVEIRIAREELNELERRPVQRVVVDHQARNQAFLADAERAVAGVEEAMASMGVEDMVEAAREIDRQI